MALNKLNARFVQTVNKPGRYADGGGLCLRVGADGRRAWYLRRDGHDHAIGSARDMTLAQAREEAEKIRGKPRGAAVTFEEALADYYETHKSEWSGGRADEWAREVEAHAESLLDMPVADIEPQHVATALMPSWRSTRESAMRMRGRIEAVLSAATVKGWRNGSNPATWRGNLQHLMPKAQRGGEQKHHASMDWRDMPDLFRRLKQLTGVPAMALRFTILTGTRGQEAREARWSEIDLDAGTWRLPARRMKARVAHEVPLSLPALEILHTMRGMRRDDYVFPGMTGGAIGPTSQYDVLRKVLGITGATVHGFRASLTDWGKDATQFPYEVRELTLAHKVGGMTERAYARSTLLEQRRQYLADWATYCTGDKAAANVVPLRRA